MTLGQLLSSLGALLLAPAPDSAIEAPISSLCYDSRHADSDSLFFALPGAKTDGNLFVHEAISRGARAVVSEQARPSGLAESVVWIQVASARKALALAADIFYGRPAQTLELIGVTGTNGKTTTTFLIDSILRADGRRSGLFGTVLYRTPKRAVLASNTTPESLELIRLLAEVRDAGGTAAILEASSHALAMNRLWGLPFAAAVFTNLTRDHLDFHQTMDGYFQAKRRLFEGMGAGAPATGIVNLDDPRGRRLVGLSSRTLTFGLTNEADVWAQSYRLSPAGLEFTAQTPVGPINLLSGLMGRVNVSNILGATATALALGVGPQAIATGIARMGKVPGRFERVESGQPYMVVVDYAHTDDALARLIETARELEFPGRILLLFGAGGERDRTKRPLMGAAAGRGADLVVVTSDNPRSENPQAIVNDILPGLEQAGAQYLVETDRARAIEKILGQAGPGDVVLLAGKGHEAYQIVGEQAIAFDDRQVAREALRKLGYTSSQTSQDNNAPEGEAARESRNGR